MNRRSLLATSFTGVAVLSAGCSDFLSNEGEEDDYQFHLYNGSEETHTFRIQIGERRNGAWFYDESFEMDGETGEEDIPISVTPATISITIDSTIERQYPWPASPHELGTAAHDAEIWYEPSREQEFYIRAQ